MTSRHRLSEFPIGIRSRRDEIRARVATPPGAELYREHCSECGRSTVGVLLCQDCGTTRPARTTSVGPDAARHRDLHADPNGPQSEWDWNAGHRDPDWP